MRKEFMGDRKIFCNLIILMFFSLLCSISEAESGAWQRLDNGLYLGKFDSPKKSEICNYKIIILKIDPKFYSFKLLSASEHDNYLKTAKQWTNKFGLLATINASMYLATDFNKSTGYMKNFNHVNNAHINRTFGAFMVFGPMDSSVPEVQIVDRHVQKNWKSLIKKYDTVVQNYRMINPKQQNVWRQSSNIFSIAAVGMDRSGNVLFIHSRSPFTVHDFNEVLLSLPINIYNAMYVEGGPEASLYIKINETEMNEVGSYETGFNENDDNNSAWLIPNVIGIVKRR
jgi:hypothetical protein